MNTSQINCFLAAAEYLNFTKAAEQLFLSQPGLSRQIASIERELGIELFERGRNSVRLTEAGAICVAYLTKVKHDLQKMMEDATRALRGKQESFIIGGLQGRLVGEFYEDALIYFWSNHPNTKIKMCYYNASELYNALVDGNVDIGIMPETDAMRLPGILYKRSRMSKQAENEQPTDAEAVIEAVAWHKDNKNPNIPIFLDRVGCQTQPAGEEI
ncbi:regulatory helix-turn-helix protein, lysR family [Sporobacter termitidis DSM 10068]|uniref:Regulatory helix-turn-helix protein, lysR family n=1 Tax=Sporobacter termitidis DSM 10068 TaxID=1123282 RepID=A0A1M5TQ42_9FIRM|nr:LysR family transcriptional regulator [Sporobacter termitidis]SHH52811.1 regulatory helix-turn-helix protein, lysR family [Sporobacter termitidis DSM 10068]